MVKNLNFESNNIESGETKAKRNVFENTNRYYKNQRSNHHIESTNLLEQSHISNSDWIETKE